MHERAEFNALNAAYRRAWRNFVIEVECRQSTNAEGIAIQQAVAAMEQAEILYRKSRNELADFMISNKLQKASKAAIMPGDLKLSIGLVHLSGSERCSSLPAA
jgi:hypothetical protein